MGASQKNQSDFMIGFREGFPAESDELVDVDRSSPEYQRGLNAGKQAHAQTRASAPHLFTNDGLLRNDSEGEE